MVDQRDWSGIYLFYSRSKWHFLPIDMVLQYNKFSGWKGESKKRRRYHVCIKNTEDDNMHLWNFNNPDVNFDIQSYFYPVK